MAQGRTGSIPRGAEALLQPGFLDELRLSWRLLRDPRVAPRLKVIIPILAVLYLVSPIDLVPDLFLGLGQIDDLGMIGLAMLALVRLVPKMAPAEVVREHMDEMGLTNNPPPPGDSRRPGEQVVDAHYRVRS